MRSINNAVVQMSWTVSTWEKPDGFVSSSNEKGQHDKPAETASESDSEDSENEAESPETNFKVGFFQIYFAYMILH